VASRDLNHDIETPRIGHRRWQVSKWDLGPSVPATEHIGVGCRRAEVWLRRQRNRCPRKDADCQRSLSQQNNVRSGHVGSGAAAEQGDGAARRAGRLCA
jgi:hypothetical protein